MTPVEDVRQRLIDSQLMTAAQADAEIARWRQEAATDQQNGASLLAWLVAQQAITDFQGEALRAGQAGPFMLGPYRVLGRVAAGRLGNLYRAMPEGVQQPVCLKLFPASLKDDREKLGRMRRELHASAGLDHPNVVRTFEIQQAGEIYYLVMEDLVGETLQDRLDRDGPLGYPIACQLIRGAALGLAHFHDKFLVHRDVRPANLWITEAGQVKVMEVGGVRRALTPLGAAEESALTTDGTVIGAYDYMPPEQVQNPHAADHRSDVYALGCTLYHCLAGHPPFTEKNPLKLLMRHATASPQPLGELVADIPAELVETVDTMLAKSPDDRFQNMRDVAAALERHGYAAEPAAGQSGVKREFLQWLQQPEATAAETPREPGAKHKAFLGWLLRDSNRPRE